MRLFAFSACLLITMITQKVEDNEIWERGSL